MGTRGRVDTSPVAQGCPRGLKLRVQYENHTLFESGESPGRAVWRLQSMSGTESIPHGGGARETYRQSLRCAHSSPPTDWWFHCACKCRSGWRNGRGRKVSRVGYGSTLATDTVRLPTIPPSWEADSSTTARYPRSSRQISGHC